jgi:hypothetical protein
MSRLSKDESEEPGRLGTRQKESLFLWSKYGAIWRDIISICISDTPEVKVQIIHAK